MMQQTLMVLFWIVPTLYLIKQITMSELGSKIKSILSEFFRDKYYSQGVKELRVSLNNDSSYSQYWEQIVRKILDKDIENPLDLVHKSANQVLDENSEEEAYKWLNLMLINSLGSKDSIIIEY